MSVTDNKTIARYWAHDPVGNVEGIVTDYDQDKLAAAEAAGIVYIAEYDDGERVRVAAADVTEPTPHVNGITLVTPKYVDTRTEATASVFDALAVIVDPEASAATADETGAAGAAADPVQAFKDALAALKALCSKGEDAGD